jgi:uncharacterized protein (DUF1697 family)
METYTILIRGINVGGRNLVPMAELQKCLEGLGYGSVSTYIASGNAFVTSDKNSDDVKSQIEQALPKYFRLDGDQVKVLVLTRAQLQAVVDRKPLGFGDEPKKYHSDVVFLIGIGASEAMAVFDPREGVDRIWLGDCVIYSQRLSALRTRSRLSKIVGTPAYQSMTVRTWGTVNKLLEIMKR